MTNIDDAAEIIGRYVHPDFAEDAARDLAAEGHLAPAPQIIRTVKGLEAIDPDTVVMLRDWHKYETAKDAVEYIYSDRTFAAALPAAVVVPAAQVRAARKALEEA